MQKLLRVSFLTFVLMFAFGASAPSAFAATLAVDVACADTTPADGTCDDLVTFKTIQSAITAATSGDTINVAAGTYTEDLSVPSTKTGLNISGAATSTTSIVGVATVAAASFPLADPNIEILGSGTRLHGFTVQSPAYSAGYYSSGVVIGAVNVEIDHNTFLTNTVTTTGDISQTIQTYATSALPGVDVSGLNIHDNTFSGQGSNAWGYEGIYINPDAATDMVTVATNTFTGNIIRAITSERSKTSITNNTIETNAAPTDSGLGTPGSWQGINIRNSATTAQSDVTVTGNTIGGSGAGLGFLQGIRTGNNGQTLTNILVNNNAIVGNTIGVNNVSSDTVDATSNWWGSASPDFGTIISGSATTDPYWTNAAMTVSSAVISALSAASASLASAGITNNLDQCATPAAATACAGLYFEKTDMGKIEYGVSLDMTDANTVALLASLGSALTMSQGKIGFNASTTAMMREAQATVSIYGLGALGYTAAPSITVLDDAGSPIATSSPNYPALGAFQYSADTNGGTLAFTTSHFSAYETVPTITETTPVSSPTSSTSPMYAFTTDVAGTLTYGGSCSSPATGSSIGSNTITLMASGELPAPFSDGTYSNCTITVADGAGHSNTITVSSFTVDTTPPTITSIASDATATGALKIGDTITFTLTPSVAEAGATVSGSYNGASLSWGTANGGTTYTATYTVTSGDADQASALQISSVTMTDAAGNTSTPASGSDVMKIIDAHPPTITTVVSETVFSPNASVGTKDTVDIDSVFSEYSDYIIAVKNASNVTVKSWTGTATNPNAKIWNGQDNSSVQVPEGTYTIVVTATDAAGNTATDSSHTVVVDNTAPVITLNGLAELSIVYGTAYSESGASADDGSVVQASDTVGTNAGDYIVTYDATDTAGNAAIQVTRTVHVTQATSSTTLSCPTSVSYAGAALAPCTVAVTGAGGLSTTTTVAYANNMQVGTATASTTYSGDANHTGSGDSASFGITPVALTVTATANSKTVDGTTSAAAVPTITLGSLQGSDTANFSETYDTADVGTGKTLTPSGFVNDGNGGNNYTYTFVPVTTGIILTATQSAPDSNGNVTVGSSAPEVVVTSASQPLSVTVGGNVTNAALNFDSLISSGTGTLPQVTASSTVGSVSVALEIPSSTVVTAANASWDGVMKLPQPDTAASGNAPSGFSVGDVKIEVGSSDWSLTFDKAVKLTLAGVTGSVGYRPAGSSNWQMITTQCTSATDHSNISSPNECYFQTGGNTIIWTYHFTAFGGLTPVAPTISPNSGDVTGSLSVTLSNPSGLPIRYTTDNSTPTCSSTLYAGAISVNAGTTVKAVSCDGVTPSSVSSAYFGFPSSGGGGYTQASSAAPATPATIAAPTVDSAAPTASAVPAQGRVLGAEAYSFTGDLHMGSTGADVIELQKVLIAEGFDIPAITKGTAAYGTFGGQTLSAVIAYQKAHGITPAAGYVGTLTRAELNKGSTPATPETPVAKGKTNLSAGQVDSILAVLESFNIDQATLDKVRAALGR